MIWRRRVGVGSYDGVGIIFVGGVILVLLGGG